MIARGTSNVGVLEHRSREVLIDASMLPVTVLSLIRAGWPPDMVVVEALP